MAKKYDFAGWATKNDMRCSDGVTIRRNAFKDNDGARVPLVWNHNHNDPSMVLGHADLENRENGVYAYCSFNDTELGQTSKNLVQHGDIVSLSIWANKLTKDGSDVVHGCIREVSLVLAGANPGAYINQVVTHSDSDEGECGEIYTGEPLEFKEELEHAEETTTKTEEKKEATKMADEKTVGEVFDEMTDEQKTVVYALIAEALEQAKNENKEGTENMKHNVFSGDDTKILSHADQGEILGDAKRMGSLKEAFLEHGITNIENFFPEPKMVGDVVTYDRDQGWVSKVMNGVKRSPFARIKTALIDITADAARAKGYMKGHLKKEEVVVALKRSTTPTTVYKKQKLDRDDVVDITDFDVVSWMRNEMKSKLNEEIARAILIGDGRQASDEDKINELNIRPIISDDELYTVHTTVADPNAAENVQDFIDAIIKARVEYKGSGSPVLFTTENVVTMMLLLKDGMQRPMYKSEAELAQALRVKEIVAVPVMEGATYTVGSDTLTADAVLVNLNDYTVGADRNGAATMFDDFDIDYNAQKYLIETRCSGALTLPKSALAFGHKA